MKKGTLIDRTEVSKKFHKGFKRIKLAPQSKIKASLNFIEEVVIHGTGGGQSANGLLNWMLKGERGKQYKKGIALFHFLIGRQGEIYQVGFLDRWYYHSSSGRHDKKTIGIELLNPEPVNMGAYTERQYVALEDLLFNMLFSTCPNICRIVSHDYNSNTYSGYRKGCPGADFRWERLRDTFKQHKIDMESKVFEDVIEFEPITIEREISNGEGKTDQRKSRFKQALSFC